MTIIGKIFFSLRKTWRVEESAIRAVKYNRKWLLNRKVLFLSLVSSSPLGYVLLTIYILRLLHE